jgi:hypothetical protein
MQLVISSLTNLLTPWYSAFYWPVLSTSNHSDINANASEQHTAWYMPMGRNMSSHYHKETPYADRHTHYPAENTHLKHDTHTPLARALLTLLAAVTAAVAAKFRPLFPNLIIVS